MFNSRLTQDSADWNDDQGRMLLTAIQKNEELQAEVDRLNAILAEIVETASENNYETVIFPKVWAVLVKHGLAADQ